jgi:hypothetical protein
MGRPNAFREVHRVAVSLMSRRQTPTDEEGGDLGLRPLLGRRRSGEDGEEVGVLAVRDPRLGPVEAEPAFRGLSACLDGGCVAPRAALRQRKGRDELALRDAWQVARLLSVGSEVQEPVRTERLMRPEEARDRGVEACDLLDDTRIRSRREPEAAERLGDQQPEEPRVREVLPYVHGDLLGGVELGRIDAAGEDTTDRLEDWVELRLLGSRELGVWEDGLVGDGALEQRLHERVGQGGLLATYRHVWSGLTIQV